MFLKSSTISEKKITILPVLVAGLGLGLFGLILVLSSHPSNFKSLKCTVSLRSLYNWIVWVADLCAVAWMWHSGW